MAKPRLIEAGRERGLLRNRVAYLLETEYHEITRPMKPINEMGGVTYLRSKKYWPCIGREYVQITCKTTYEKTGRILGIDLVSKPKLLLESKYAAPIIIAGMVEGWFTSK